MLVKLTDIKGNEMWVNPAYVKGVRARRSGAQVFTSAFGGSLSGTIKVAEPVEELVARLSAAMPTTAELAAIVSMDEEAQRAAASAAIAAG